MTAEELSNEKDSNEAAWKKRYLSKQAVIYGEIALIEGAGSYYDVKLRGDDLFVHIVCKIRQSDAAKAAVLALQVGQNTCVFGRVTDDGIVDIVVEDCSLQ